MPIKADTIRGFREMTTAVLMEKLDELGLIKPAKKSTPKPPPDPLKIMKPKPTKPPANKAKGKAKKVASILLVFGLASFMLCGNSFALLRPRNMDQVTTDTWTFQNVNIATGASIVAVTMTGEATIGDATGAVTFNSGTYNTSNSDDDITNVGDIAVDTISADDGSSFAISDDFTNAGNTIADLGIVTTVDVNGGSIDGAIIGAASAAAISGSTITGTTITDGTASVTGGTFSGIADLGAVTTADINAGTVDAVLGGTTPAAATVTTLTGSGNFNTTGTMNYGGDSTSTDANTYVIDCDPDLVVTTPTNGQVITWTSDTVGDGASTISVDGVSDTIQDRAGNATAAGDVIVGPIQMQFDGTNWRLIGI